METKYAFALDSRTVEYSIVREARKTLKIVISPMGEVSVSVPRRMTLREVDVELNRHIDWLKKKLALSDQLRKEYCEIYERKAAMLYGKRIPIVRENNEGRRARIELRENRLVACNCPQNLKDQLDGFYKRQTLALVERLVEAHSRRSGFDPSLVTAKRQKRLWGSCNARRELRFNQFLCMLPIDVIEYVVVHELCHLRQMNHSKAFWNEVAAILPDYLARRRTLREYGGALAGLNQLQ